MKLLFFSNLYHPNVVGGAEKFVQMLAEALPARGVTPVVVSTSDTCKVDIVNGVKVYYIKVPNLFWIHDVKRQTQARKNLWHLTDSCNLLTGPIVSKILDIENPDLVHTSNLQGFSPYLWRIASRRRIPVVHTIQDYYLLCPRNNMFRNGSVCRGQCLECRILSLPKRALSRHVDCVIGITGFVLDRHLGFGCFHRTPLKKVIPHPAEASLPAVPAPSRDEKRGPVFGFAGLVCKHKGIEHLLRAFSRLDRAIGARLEIFGRGITEDYEAKLRSDYGEIAGITFHGFAAPAEIYPAIDVLVVPSLWHEPLGRVILEAYSCGRPVIVSNMGGMPEMVTHGTTGFVFDPADDDGLLAELRRFAENRVDLPELSRNALARSRKYDLDKIVDGHLEIYRALTCRP